LTSLAILKHDWIVAAQSVAFRSRSLWRAAKSTWACRVRVRVRVRVGVGVRVRVRVRV